MHAALHLITDRKSTMRDDLRDRFFTPFVLPVTVIGVMLLFGISLARILLAVSELAAALLAMLAAGYIMAMAFFVEARRRIPPRALGAALAVGLIGLVAAGAAASAAGIREVEHAEEGGEGGGEAAVASPDLPEGEVFVAQDILYAQAPETVPTGDLTFVLENQGQIEHNVVMEDLGDELIVEAAPGEVETGDVTLEAGDYVYYCSIPGHREAGMEGTLTAEEGAASGGGGASEAGEGASEDAGGAGASEAGTADDDESENAT